MLIPISNAVSEEAFDINKLEINEAKYTRCIDLLEFNPDSIVIEEYNYPTMRYMDSCVVTVDTTTNTETALFYNSDGVLIEKNVYHRIKHFPFDVYITDIKVKFEYKNKNNSNYINNYFDYSHRLKYYQDSKLFEDLEFDFKNKKAYILRYYPDGTLSYKMEMIKGKKVTEIAYDKKGKEIVYESYDEILKKSITDLYSKLEYPELLRKAAIESSFEIILVLDDMGFPLKMIFPEDVAYLFIETVAKAISTTAFRPEAEGVTTYLVIPLEFRLN